MTPKWTPNGKADAPTVVCLWGGRLSLGNVEIRAPCFEHESSRTLEGVVTSFARLSIQSGLLRFPPNYDVEEWCDKYSHCTRLRGQDGSNSMLFRVNLVGLFVHHAL